MYKVESRPKSRNLSVRVDEGDALWQLLRRTARAIAKTREHELGKYGFTPDEAVVIFTVIRQRGKATAASIARELLLEPNSISEQLTRMEKDGFVRRVRDTENRNRVSIEITDKGFEIYRKSASRRSTRDVMSSLTSAEIRTMWQLLARLRERALKQLGMKSSDLYPPEDPDLLKKTRQSRLRD